MYTRYIEDNYQLKSTGLFFVSYYAPGIECESLFLFCCCLVE